MLFLNKCCLLDDFVIIYFDDIVVYRITLPTFKIYLQEIKEHKLYLKKEKCLFAQDLMISDVHE